MNVVTDDMVQAALDAYSENEWRTSASAMRAALAAVAPADRSAGEGAVCSDAEAIADRVEPPGAKRVNQVDRHTAGILRDKAAAIRQEPGHE